MHSIRGLTGATIRLLCMEGPHFCADIAADRWKGYTLAR
jgi:hypothetical protein